MFAFPLDPSSRVVKIAPVTGDCALVVGLNSATNRRNAAKPNAIPMILPFMSTPLSPWRRNTAKTIRRTALKGSPVD